MKRLIIEQSTTETYTSHSGLALVGLCLNRYSTIHKALKAGCLASITLSGLATIMMAG